MSDECSPPTGRFGTLKRYQHIVKEGLGDAGRMTVSALDLQKLCKSTEMKRSGGGGSSSLMPKRSEKKKKSSITLNDGLSEAEKHKKNLQLAAEKRRADLAKAERLREENEESRKRAEEAEKQRRQQLVQQSQESSSDDDAVQKRARRQPRPHAAQFSPPTIHDRGISCTCSWKYNEAVLKWVEDRAKYCESEVVCAPRVDESMSGLRCFQEIEPPTSEEQLVQDFQDWHQYSKWTEFVVNIATSDAADNKKTRGSNNVVYEKSDIDAFNGADIWPPQFEYAGRKGVGGGLALPEDARDPAIRMTNTKSTRCNTFVGRDDIVTEMAYMLYFALTGIGPPVYALHKFSCKALPQNIHQRGWGLLSIMQKCHPFETIKSSNPLSDDQVHRLSHNLACCCQKMASCGFVDFDTKPANFVIKDKSLLGVFRIDFDRAFVRHIADDSVLTEDGRYFINLFFLTLHFHLYHNLYGGFEQQFVSYIKRELKRLYLALYSDVYNNAGQNFGSVAAGLFNQQLRFGQYDEDEPPPKFDNIRLEQIQNSRQRITEQFKMMIWEYFYSVKEKPQGYDMFARVRNTELAREFMSRNSKSFRIIPFFMGLILNARFNEDIQREVTVFGPESRVQKSALASL